MDRDRVKKGKVLTWPGDEPSGASCAPEREAGPRGGAGGRGLWGDSQCPSGRLLSSLEGG